MYALYHPDYTPQRWQIFIAFIGITWLDCAIVLFGQRVLPKFATAGGCICMAAVFIIVMVCAIMPSQTGYGYATNAFVWTEWQNGTGWSSNGYVFVAGMLNGAFAIGTPDGVSFRNVFTVANPDMPLGQPFGRRNSRPQTQHPERHCCATDNRFHYHVLLLYRYCKSCRDFFGDPQRLTYTLALRGHQSRGRLCDEHCVSTAGSFVPTSRKVKRWNMRASFHLSAGRRHHHPRSSDNSRTHVVDYGP